MTRRFKWLHPVLVVAFMFLLSGPRQILAQADVQPFEGRGSAATLAPAAEPSYEAPPAAEVASDFSKAEEKHIRADWALMAFEDRKVGYVNKVINELHVDGKLVGHRLVISRFMKLDLSEEKPTYYQKSVLNLDTDWQAVSFSTETRRGLDLVTVSGQVAGGQLQTTINAAGETRKQTMPVKSPVTFAGAFLQAVTAAGLKPGATFSATTIDEQWGAYNETPRFARVLRATRVPAAGGSGNAEVMVVAERTGIFEVMHWVYPSGRVYRSEGGVHHLSVRESSIHESRGLKLEGTVDYQNRIPIQSGRTLDSGVCGYQLTVPPYPFLPLVFRDGTLVILSNQFTADHVMLTVTRAAAGGADSQRLLFRNFSRLMGTPSEVAETSVTVAGIPALRFDGDLTVGGRQGWFSTVVASRGEFYYIFSQVGVWPTMRAERGRVLDEILDSVRWTKIFGRERGRWDGPQYISESHGFRLRMLDEGWQIPEERSGVATSVEAVRNDRSALLAVEMLELDAGTTLAQAAEQYLQRLRNNLPEAEVQQTPQQVAGTDGLMISYEGRAIDDEPTASQHLLAIRENHLLVLTLVTKKSSAEVNTKHYQAAAESLRLGRSP